VAAPPPRRWLAAVLRRLSRWLDRIAARLDPIPVLVDQVLLDQVLLDPVRPDPFQPDPFRPDLVHPDLVRSDPFRPDLAHPDLVRPDPFRPDLVHPDLVHPDLGRPGPRPRGTRRPHEAEPRPTLRTPRRAQADDASAWAPGPTDADPSVHTGESWPASTLGTWSVRRHRRPGPWPHPWSAAAPPPDPAPGAPPGPAPEMVDPGTAAIPGPPGAPSPAAGPGAPPAPAPGRHRLPGPREESPARPDFQRRPRGEQFGSAPAPRRPQPTRPEPAPAPPPRPRIDPPPPSPAQNSVLHAREGVDPAQTVFCARPRARGRRRGRRPPGPAPPDRCGRRRKRTLRPYRWYVRRYRRPAGPRTTGRRRAAPPRADGGRTRPLAGPADDSPCGIKASYSSSFHNSTLLFIFFLSLTLSATITP
jgi:hypothetical protein